MSDFNPYKFDDGGKFNSLADRYALAINAEAELKQARKVIWLLLKQIGEPVTIDATSLLQVPDDHKILEIFEPCANGTITMEAV